MIYKFHAGNYSRFREMDKIRTYNLLYNIQSVNTGYISPAPVHVVQLAVSLEVNDIFRYFLGEAPKSLNKRVAFSPETLDIQSALYEKATDCDVCGKGC